MVEDQGPSRFRDLTLVEFVRRLSSAEPVPGGGSASAVAASLGAALVSMVAALSQGRPKYAAHEATHLRAAAAGERLADLLLQLADDDARAYAAFAAAMKQPQETDADRAARAAAIQRAARQAAEVPLATVEACGDVVAAAEELAGRSNVNAASDLDVAVLLAEAAARGAAANVIINLPSLGDEPTADELRRRVEVLLDEIARLARQVRDVVASGVARDEPAGAR